MIKGLQDKSLKVMYLQIFLDNHFGVYLHKVVPRRRTEQSYIELYSGPIEVTGSYNLQTYSAASLYMAYNYPNEGFPCRWTYTSRGWESQDFFYDSSRHEDLIDLIWENMENSSKDHITVSIPDRVLSYFFDEVVTPKSSLDEISRVRRLFDPDFVVGSTPLEFTEDLTESIRKVQSDFIERHTDPNGKVLLPPQFVDFKVTGYVDPWTEVVIKGGLE